MFLSVQGFSKSPEGKGLKCYINKTSNGKEVPHHKRLFFWFDKKKFLKFTLIDSNGKVEWSVGYKSLNDISSSYWEMYTFNSDFIAFNDFSSSA